MNILCWNISLCCSYMVTLECFDLHDYKISPMMHTYIFLGRGGRTNTINCLYQPHRMSSYICNIVLRIHIHSLSVIRSMHYHKKISYVYQWLWWKTSLWTISAYGTHLHRLTQTHWGMLIPRKYNSTKIVLLAQYKIGNWSWFFWMAL